MKKSRHIIISVIAAVTLTGTGAAVLLSTNDENSNNSRSTNEKGNQSLEKEIIDSKDQEIESPVHSTRTNSKAHQLETRSQDFNALKSCVLSVQRAVDLTGQVEACRSFPEGDAATLACRERTRGFDREIEDELRKSKDCQTRNLTDLEDEFFNKAREEAKAGNADAQLCYIGLQLELNRHWSATEIDEFKEAAPRYAEEALQRGDWRIVALMMTSPRVLAHSDGPLQYLVGDDPVAAYRMNRLARLGAVGDYADQLDILSSDSEKMLPSGTEIGASTWAEKMYNDRFRRSPPLHEAPTICGT